MIKQHVSAKIESLELYLMKLEIKTTKKQQFVLYTAVSWGLTQRERFYK